jgi:phage terminase large subunit
MNHKQPEAYNFVKNSKKRFVVLQGSTRSAKTYSILQFIIELCCTNPNAGLIIDIIRQHLPTAKSTVYQDFINILKIEGIFSNWHENKTSSTYKLQGNLISFFGASDDQKIRGRKRDIAFLNEANELSQDIFNQINLRTKYRVIIDYNPSFYIHDWIDPLLLRNEEVDFKIVTYKDNPFLEKQQINEIEKLKQTDENMWRIYGLGLRGIPQGQVFTNWLIDPILKINYQGKKKGNYQLFDAYGLDFGDNDPTVLIGIKINKAGVTNEIERLEIFELIYKTHLEINELVNTMKSLGVNENIPIYCDHRPEIIRYISKAGFWAKPAIKGRNSIKQGIQLIKNYKVFLHPFATNIITEFKNYSYIKKDGVYTDTPIDAYNHGIDAIRYALTGYNKHKQELSKGGGVDIPKEDFSFYGEVNNNASSFV